MATAVEPTVNGRMSAITTAETVPTSRVAPPVKLRRRPIVMAAGAACTILGALLAAYAWTATTSTQEVVAVRDAVLRGEVIERADLMTVQVSLDPALRSVPGDDLPAMVGRRAAVDMPAGVLVTPESVTSSVIPPEGLSVVGIAVPASLLPGESLLPGDDVRVVATSGPQGDVAVGTQRTLAANVVGVYPDAETGQTVVSVLVSADDAPELAARAASGRVAIVLDSRER